MNGRKSYITKLVLSQKNNRTKMFSHIKETGSVVGTVVSVNNNKYVIVDNPIENINEKVSNFKTELAESLGVKM